MPRTSTVHIPNGTYFVVLRSGIPQLFESDLDRSYAEGLLEHCVDTTNYKLHAYSWTSREMLLVLETSDKPLSTFMRKFAGLYSRFRRKGRKVAGLIFAGPYRAVLLDERSYLLKVIRIAHLYPFRAGGDGIPHYYRWSSDPVYRGVRTCNWVTTSKVLERLGDSQVGGVAYTRVMSARLTAAECRPVLHGSIFKPMILGNPGEIASLRRRARGLQRRQQKGGDVDALIKRMCNHLGVDERLLATDSQARQLCKARAAIATAAITMGIATLADMARRFNRSRSSLCESLTNQRGRHDFTRLVPRR